MALAQHKSYDIRFQQQVDNARNYLIPFIEESFPLTPGIRVMEIGCGEGGVLRPFVEKGAQCLGVDLSASRIERAKERMQPEIAAGKASFLAQNVYDGSFLETYRQGFDLILLKDTIEHIPQQEKFIPYLNNFLKPEGRIFFGFPPWRMPFGGHQQICESKLLGYLPYFHLLPMGVYQGILRLAGEPERTRQELREIKETGISLYRFEKIIKQSQFVIENQRLFLLNPIYQYKFGVKPIVQAPWLAAIPHLRDSLTTAGWYIIKR